MVMGLLKGGLFNCYLFFVVIFSLVSFIAILILFATFSIFCVEHVSQELKIYTKMPFSSYLTQINFYDRRFCIPLVRGTWSIVPGI